MKLRARKATAAIASVLTLSLAATACGSDDGDSGSGGDKIVIGIKFDQPGVGLKTKDGKYTGFDVDVATYVAKELGYDAKDIEWKQTPSAQRETMLANGDVEFITASYSITDKRKEKVDFAGPYFLAHQDLLIRNDETGITKAEDLNSKKLCSVTGSTSAQNVKDELAPKADLQTLGGYSECLTGLENKSVDALTTDDAILAGYASQPEHQGKFKLAGLKLSDENYGIGVKKGNSDLKGKINKALEKMKSDGSWEKFVQANFSKANYKYEPAPAIDAS
ncbi:glutamate ABC transporter substrate-binding protein [Streptomyces sp. NPDC051018]|uniref:glutamate ABC transporter substrate-binding protein n=1 Tax=Streptomyces sp. NPDC051018 TaxID=3365639 RepID=UPI0037A6861E